MSLLMSTRTTLSLMVLGVATALSLLVLDAAPVLSLSVLGTENREPFSPVPAPGVAPD